MKIIISHPTGNQNVRNAIKSLEEKNSLDCFITSFNLTIEKKFLFFLPKHFQYLINRRSYKNYTTKIISSAFLYESVRIVMSRFFKWLKIKNNFDTLNIKIDTFTAKYISKNNNRINAVYAYDEGALDSFREAKKHNIKCIYEYPVAHYKFTKVNISAVKQRRKSLEMKLADLIIVPSTWAAKSFSHLSKYKSKIRIVPYGCPENVNTNRNNWYNGKKPLKVLYVGQLSDGKGIPFLIRALAKIPEKLIQMTFVGSGLYENILKKKFPRSKFVYSCSHEEVLQTMRDNDVFVLPSLSEGFGMVISEAMSQGMAVISTKNTALQDIYNGSNCILIPAGNEKKIYKSILFLITNPNKVKKIGLSALNYCKKNTWAKYRKKLYTTLNSYL